MHSKMYAEPAHLLYVVACPLYKNVRCVIVLHLYNVGTLIYPGIYIYMHFHLLR